MSTKVYYINSNQAQYSDQEFAWLQSLFLTEGIVGDQENGELGLLVTEETPLANMSVNVGIGKALIEITKSGRTFKVIAEVTAEENIAVTNNTTGDDRIDAVIVRVDVDNEPNVLKSNIVTLEVIEGNGNIPLSDNDIQTEIGSDSFYRLANITVADSAVQIQTADISDTRSIVYFNNGIGFSPLFINESEANPIPANNEGKIVKLEDDGKFSNKFIKGVSLQGVVGENIDASASPKAVFIHNGDTFEKNILSSDNANSTSRIVIDVTERASQAFLNTEYDFITEVSWRSVQSGIDAGDTLFVELFAVDGSDNPTGTALVTKTFTSTSYIDGGSICRFDSPVAVSRNTKYAVVMRANSTSADEYQFDRRTVNPSSVFPSEVRFFNGSWSVAGNWAGNFYVKGYQDLEIGKLYLSDKNFPQRNKFDGFIQGQNLSVDELGYLYTSVINGFTGLTESSIYYIDEDGDIANSGLFPVAKAISETEVKILKNGIFTEKEIIYEGILNNNSIEGVFEKDGFIFGEIDGNGTSGSVSLNISDYISITSGSSTIGQPFCFPVKAGESWEIQSSPHDNEIYVYFRALLN